MSLMPAPSQRPKIFIVDDDPSVHDVLSQAIWFDGFEPVNFPDGNSFLAAASTQRPACVLLDISMPRRSGLEILQDLNAKTYPAPIVMLSARRDVPSVVTALKAGAKDFIEKPFDVCTVLERVQDLINLVADDESGALPRLLLYGEDRLTRREREVLSHIIKGSSNKEMSRLLGISIRTIEVHRAHVMQKLRAKNAAHLVNIVLGGDKNT